MKFEIGFNYELQHVRKQVIFGTFSEALDCVIEREMKIFLKSKFENYT